MTQTKPRAKRLAKSVDAPEIRARSREQRRTAVIAFVRDRPVLALAGGVAGGLLIGALLPRRSTRIGRNVGHIAELAGAAAVTLARQALEQAEQAGDATRRASEVAGERARDWSGLASDRLETLGGSAADRFAHLAGVASDILSRAGAYAAEQAQNAKGPVEDVAQSGSARVSRAASGLRALLSR